jgi:putative hemolysin
MVFQVPEGVRAMTRSSYILFAACVACLLCIALPAHAMLNPSAVYCTAMGYQYEIADLPDGSQDGYCRMPDHTWVNAWKFFRNQEGQKYSYCSRMGYPSKTSFDPKACQAVWDSACTVCTLPGGREVEVATLMNLNLYETTCGDGRCVIAENYKNCPADCPQSGNDGYCQAILDFRCDPDCAVDKGDIDCLYLGNPLLTILVIILIIAAALGALYLIRKRKTPKT